MSRLTDYAENKLIDYFRGQGLTLPASWHIAALSASGDPAASSTEITWSGYARIAVARSLTAWSGAQGAGTTTASTGSSHTTRNNAAIAFGTPGGTPGSTMRAIGLFDASTGGNCWMTAQLTTFISPTAGVPIVIDADLASFAIGTTGGLSDYLANKLIDLIWRGQAYAWPATTYAALYTAAPGNGGGGTEVSGGAYARQPIASSLTAWSGTQAAGTTTASTGTGGEMSNNNVVTFPSPTADWGVVTHGGLRDAATAGNLLFWDDLGQVGTVRAYSSAPAYQAAALKVKVA